MTDNQRRYPDHVEVWDFREFMALPEYSGSVPTGVVRGKRWRCDLGGSGVPPRDWWMGEFGDDAPAELPSMFPEHGDADPEPVSIRWTKIFFGPRHWTEEPPTTDGLYLLRPKEGGPAVFVEVIDGWAETPDEEPGGDRFGANFFVGDIDQVEWFLVRPECDNTDCDEWVEAPGFRLCRMCRKARARERRGRYRR